MGICNTCGSATCFRCKCVDCKAGKTLQLEAYYCTVLCSARDREDHEIKKSRLLADCGPVKNTTAQVLHTTWQKGDFIRELGVERYQDEMQSSTSPAKAPPILAASIKSTSIVATSVGSKPATKEVTEAGTMADPDTATGSNSGAGTSKSKPVKAKKNKPSKTHKDRTGAENVEARARAKSAKALTLLFNKLKQKICILEPLTPSWKWVCNVDKNTENSRSSKHKYKSADKLQDLTQKVANNRLSRIWGECIELAKKIELLDKVYSVTVEAIKPGTERHARLSKHRYKTLDPNAEEDVEMEESEASSQELSQGSSMSQASSLGDKDTEMSIDCRICREPILLDNVSELIACTIPSGIAHFGSHFECLGFYPKASRDRESIRSTYRCPRHSAK